MPRNFFLDFFNPNYVISEFHENVNKQHYLNN